MYHRFPKAKIRSKCHTNGYTPFGKYEGKNKGILNYIKRGHKSMLYLMKRPILPIGDIKARNPMQKKQAINKYTVEERQFIHKALKNITETELSYLRNLPFGSGQRATIEDYDNRIALYIAQKSKCPISGTELLKSMHLHHKELWSQTHDDSYKNLILINENVHRLVHAVQ